MKTPHFRIWVRGIGQTNMRAFRHRCCWEGRDLVPAIRDLMRAYAASPAQVTRTVTIPGALPFLFTGLRIASSTAVIAAVVAEYFGGLQDGLGSRITSAAANSAYARAWAFVLGAIVLGLVFYLVTLAAERAVARRQGA